MSPQNSSPAGDVNAEAAALIEALHEAAQRLEELTAGEVDTVADRHGRMMLLRRAQDHMRHSEAAKQAAILNALPAHIALLDRQGVIVSVNETWQRFAKASVIQAPQYGIGLNYLDICDRAEGEGEGAAEAHQIAAGIRSVLNGELKHFSLEYPYHTPTEQCWFLLTVTPLRPDDHLTGVLAMHVDITERKRLEELYLQAQKLESLGTLAGGIAHDFNNILAAIRGNADLAAADLGANHIASESLAEIRKACERASELVRRLMAFGRPKGIQHRAVDLGAVVSEVLKLLRSTLPAGISLTKNFAKDTPHVLADAGQVHEVIVNLTTNAAYAIGPRAGSIVYRLESVRVSEEFARSIPGLNAGDYARLTVTDSGSGIDADSLGRIFDAFYTTKPVGEGTGLGLSMVHGTMRSRDGAITVENTLGKGASFALYFPAAQERAQAEQAAAPVQYDHAAGQRVLYVDDEEALVFLASRVLSRQGHQISGFTDPEKALEAFRAHPQDFDLVVTDLSMPQMSGLDLARGVLAVRPDIPVLMTTGYIRAEDEGNARAAGIRELILKPTTMDELGHVLDRLFRNSQPRG